MYKCNNCGKSFEKQMALCGHLAQCGKEKEVCRICGQKISAANMHSHIYSHKDDKKCLECSKIVRGKKKFCNNSCSVSYNNKGKVRNGKPAANCLECGKKLKSSKGKFCSNKCQQEYQYKVFIKQWLSNVIDGSSSNGMTVSRYIYRYIKEKEGDKCSICGLREWMGKPIPLVLDHIDGNP